jgi:phosphatidylglycerol:prolipoprotein diacylglycerol transferase
VHPIAFHLGSLPIRWYGVMMALGFFSGLWTATRRAQRVNVPGDVIADVTTWLLVGSIIGARFVFVTTYWKQEFAGKPFTEVFMIQNGGLVYYGGLIGAAVAAFIYLTWKNLPLWKILDILAPSAALGSVFGRLGCLLNGCCFGHPCDLPWAVHFPPEHETHGVAVHPTQVYDALLNLGLYFVLAWWFRHRKFDGQIFAVYLMAYAVIRSVAELFRGDYPADHIHAGLLTSAQMVSLPVLATGMAVWFWRSRSVAARKQT